MKSVQHHGGKYHFEGIDFTYRTGSHCHFHDPWTNHPHLHEDYYEICLVTSGNGLYRHGSKEWDLTRGDVFIADPGVIHEISSPEHRDLRLIFGTFSYELKSKGKSPEENLLSSFDHSHHIHEKGREDLLSYEALLSRPPVESLSPWASSMVMFFLFEMIESLCDKSLEPLTSNSNLEKARLKVSEWGERDFTLEELAKSCGCSLRTLRRDVTRITGQPLGSWVHGLRLERAARLLRMNFRIGETARACGYDDPDRFTRLFKSRFGTTPKRYQMQAYEDMMSMG
jgi:AraC-like DNA-binding protein/quercetin dioxygenase-like cupin family protein